MWPTDETACTFGVKADEVLPPMPKHGHQHVLYRKRASHELEPAVQKGLPTSPIQDEVGGARPQVIQTGVWKLSITPE